MQTTGANRHKPDTHVTHDLNTFQKYIGLKNKAGKPAEDGDTMSDLVVKASDLGDLCHL